MIRQAIEADITAVMKIIQETIAEMRSYGNTQWDENYPREKDFLNDIHRGDLYIIEREDEVAGFACVNTIEPNEYNGLPWSRQQPAIVIHRMAVDPSRRRSGLGTALMQFAEEYALKKQISYLKTDTYSINTKMNALFSKCGYKLVGEMRFRSREKAFYCYEKILSA